ncbi:hypothetical protein [Candidatus Corynebacterium faecigallinarum]|uniref:hypothetical protein n=1 Tax=Candidatus Corynebacterium faecigallinarum TaxID=2838528 RepID=UPI003FB75A4A
MVDDERIALFFVISICGDVGGRANHELRPNALCVLEGALVFANVASVVNVAAAAAERTKLEGEEVPWRSVSGFILAYWFGYYGKQLLSKSNSIGAMFVGANEIFVVDVCDDLKFLVPRAFSPLGGDLPAVLV